METRKMGHQVTGEKGDVYNNEDYSRRETNTAFLRKRPVL
jgi:hypothetical protein